MSGRYANGKKGAARERRLRRGWRQVISILSLLVVFATISSLTLPAITLDYAGCGLEEHSHTEACYTPSEESRLSCPVELHVHTEACKDDAGALICGKADYAVHTHDEMCSDAAGNVVCALNERKAHAHSDACYEIRQTEVTEAHAHTDDCYEMTKDTEPTCGQTHGHTGNCYAMVRGALLCGKEESEAVYEDEKVLVCTEEECTVHVHDENCGEYCSILEVAAHQHTEECFETGWLVLTCEKPEHTHGTACYSDPEADVETPEDWEKTLPAAEELTATWAENVVMVARSQLGYEESTKNYLVSEDQSIQGYTRYGAWYGNKYAEWCAMFLAFCMNYAGVPEEAVPHHAGVESLKNSFEELETYFAAEDYTPVPGDIVFYDRDGDGRPNHVGLVAALEEIPVEPESTEESTEESTDESTDESSEESTEALLPEEEKIENTELTKPGAEAEEPTETSEEAAEPESTEATEEPSETSAEATESTEESTEATEESAEESTEPETIWLLTAIEGNCDKAVKEVTYDLTDETILGYMSLAKAQEVYILNGGELSTELVHQLTSEGEDYTVTVYYSDAALIPAGSTLTAREILPGEEAYDDYISRSREALAGYGIGEARLFDITILDENGAEVQPATDVRVDISYANGFSASAAGYQAVHFGAEGTEVLPVQTQEDEEGAVTGFTHTQSGFSVTVIAEITAPAGASYYSYKPVRVMVYSDYEWIEAGVIQGVFYKEDISARCFFTDAQVYSVLKDYDYVMGFRTGTTTDGNTPNYQCYESRFGYQPDGTNWAYGVGLAKNMYLDGCRWQLPDGNWANGLSGLDATSWTVYYLPSNYTGGYPGKARQSAVITPTAMMQNDVVYRYANGFFSYNVKYWVYINDAWTCVGSTDRGYLGAVDNANHWNINHRRDYIPESYIVEMFGPYGYSSSSYVGSSVAYHARTGSKYGGKYTSDTGEFDAHGNRVYLMGRTGDELYTDRHAGYDLYYIPAGSSAATGNDPLNLSVNSANELITGTGAGQGSGNKFYTVSVQDPFGKVYVTPGALVNVNGSNFKAEEEIALRYGTAVTITVNKGRENVSAWEWVFNDGTRTAASGTDNGDGTMTFTTTVTRQLSLQPAVDLCNAALYNDVSVKFLVYLDDAWQQVGATHAYAVGTVGENPASDPNSPFYGATNRFFITADQLYAAYGQYGFHVSDLQRWKAGDPAILGWRKGNSGNIVMGSMALIDDLPSGVMVFPFWTERGSFEVYYIPNYIPTGLSNNVSLDELSTAALDTNSAYYTVSVEDTSGKIYTAYETAGKTQIVRRGGEIALLLDSQEGVTWSAETAAGIGWEDTEVSILSGGSSVQVTVSNVASPLIVKATAIDPSFRVQYYANVEHIVFADSDESVAGQESPDRVTMPIIDTSGKVLPKNTDQGSSGSVYTDLVFGETVASGQQLKFLVFNKTGTDSDQGEGYYGIDRTKQYVVATELEHTKMYADSQASFLTKGSIETLNKLRNNTSYTLEKVGVLKEGKSAASMQESDFYWYYYNPSANAGQGNIFLTNRAENANAPLDDETHPSTRSYTLLVTEGFTLRFFYVPVKRSYTHSTTFHDYSITSNGSNARLNGINTLTNYDLSKRTSDGSSTNKANIEPAKYDGSNFYGVYAFGNLNTPNGVGRHLWNGNIINGYNRTAGWYNYSGTYEYYGSKNVFRGCTFQMVTGLDSSGKPIFDSTIAAPTNLFGTGAAAGKKTYTNGSLTFSQVGDSYILSSANSGAGSRVNLDKLFSPSAQDGAAHYHIYTNNFWVMDGDSYLDPKFGALDTFAADIDGVVKFRTNDELWGYWNEINHNGPDTLLYGGGYYTYAPASDDGVDHNFYFGMESKISFSLAADYAGPLDYTFFGDDDMWIFLRNDDTGKVEQICDIGGVHSAVGSYTNLRDYLPYGTSGNYTLHFFYTERGGSGSTCWMNFILPAVSAPVEDAVTGSLTVSKELQDASGNAVESNELFKFQLRIYTDSSKKYEYNRDYHAEILNADGTVEDYFAIYSGRTFSITSGQKAVISGLPVGAACQVTELDSDGYNTTVNGVETNTATVTIGDDITGTWLSQIPDGDDPANYETRTLYRSRQKTYTPASGGQWVQSGSGTVKYVKSSDWPSVIKSKQQSHSIYTTYNKAEPTNGENAGSTKRTVGSETLIGYIYWHYCSSYYTGGIDAGWYPTMYTTFHATFSTVTPTYYSGTNDLDGSKILSWGWTDVLSSMCGNVTAAYYLPVYQKSYTDYTWQAATGGYWSDWSDWSNWSTTKVDAVNDSGLIREVQTKIEYREKEAYEGLEFVNRAGSILPETGGSGTEAYYILGLGLTLCAAWVLLRRRRADCQ